jgi:hypothetical protein
VIEGLVNQHLALAKACALRTINGHGAMHSPEALFGREADVEAQPRCGRAAVLAALETKPQS